jgi:hypothetical protein
MLTIKLSAGTINCRGRDPIEILRCQLLLINGLGHNKKYTSRLQAYSQKIKLSVEPQQEDDKAKCRSRDKREEVRPPAELDLVLV